VFRASKASPEAGSIMNATCDAMSIGACNGPAVNVQSRDASGKIVSNFHSDGSSKFTTVINAPMVINNEV
jgi:hypothetical protein